MELPEPKANPYAPVDADAENFHFDQSPKDEVALALCLQDMAEAEAWVMEKRWSIEWDNSAVLFSAPSEPKFWPGTEHPRAHLSVPLVATHISSILPQIMDGLFGNDPPFMLRPRPGTSADAARAHGAIIGFQLEDINFKHQFEIGVRNLLLFGTSVWRWGWESFKQKRKTYSLKGSDLNVPGFAPGTTITAPTEESTTLVEDEIEISVSRPTFEAIDIRHVFFDPSLADPDIRKGRFVLYRDYLTANDLDNLRNMDGYKIPDRDTLRAIFTIPKEQTYSSPLESIPLVLERRFAPVPRWEATTADPLEQPIEVLERWDHDNVIVVLNRKVVIRNENHGLGTIPFVSCNYMDIPGSSFGYGLGKLIGGEQRLQQSIINARLDETSLNMMGTYVRRRGSNPLSQNIFIRPGGIIEDDNPQDFRPLSRLPAVPEAFAEIEASDSRAERISAANEMVVQGGLPSGRRSSITRTATGVSALTSASGSRLQYLVDKLEQQVFTPFLIALVQMNINYLSPTDVRRLLDEELNQAYQGSIQDFYNARIKFSVMAASKMQEKRAMAQSLPILFQLLFQGPIPQLLTDMGQKINVQEAVQMVFTATGWRDKQSLIVPMTAQDKANMAQSNVIKSKAAQTAQNVAQKGQQKSQQMAQQHQNRLQQIEASTAGKAWLQAQDRVLRGIEEREMLEGNFGGVKGFGDQADQDLTQ